MRRAKTALLVGGVLAVVTACGTGAGTTAAGTPAPGPGAAGAVVEPATKATCEAVGTAYTKNIGPFAEALTKLVTDRTAVKVAQQKLDAFSTSIRTATADSADAQFRTDGKQTADQLHAKSADAAFFGTVKTAEDVNTVLGPTLKEWLAPVTHHCS